MPEPKKSRRKTSRAVANRTGEKVGGSGTAAKSRQGPLSSQDLALIDAYWRAANYLSVGQIYLLDNPLLREPLQPDAREAAPAGPLGHDAGPQLHLRAHEPGDPRLGPRRHLRHGARPRRPGHRGQRLPRGHLLGGLPDHHARRRRPAQAVPAVLVPGRHPQPRGAGDAGLHPRGRRAGLRARARLRRRLRQPRPGRLLRRRRRRGGDGPARRRAGTPTSSSTRSATAPCCRSSTSTATRSPTRRCWRASLTKSWRRSSRATATTPTSSRATTRRACTSTWRPRWTPSSRRSRPSSAPRARAAPPSARAGR